MTGEPSLAPTWLGGERRASRNSYATYLGCGRAPSHGNIRNMHQEAPTVWSALRSALLAALTVTVACGTNGATSRFVSDNPTASPTSAPTIAPEFTKPPVSQAPLPPPTHVRWAIDHSDQPGRHLFELHYDGTAMGFRVVDATGGVLIVVPIAGSGIFGPETCMVAAKAGADVATWVGVDEATYQDLLAHAASYLVEVETIGHGTTTLPLVDTGCRRS